MSSQWVTKVFIPWEHGKGWRLHSSSGEPAPLLVHLHDGKGFPLVALEPPLL